MAAEIVSPRLPASMLTIALRTVPPEQEAAYSAIIDDLLKSSDLETVSAKRIRKGLQDCVDYDISSQKVRTRSRLTSTSTNSY